MPIAKTRMLYRVEKKSHIVFLNLIGQKVLINVLQVKRSGDSSSGCKSQLSIESDINAHLDLIIL